MDTDLENTYNIYVCLGNIGKEYEKTRHNAGFIFGEQYIKHLHDKGFDSVTKEEKTYISVTFKVQKIVFLFPKTLMNLSGRAIDNFLSYSNIEGYITVVHDDLDLPVGEFKIAVGKGPKTHNGLSSIEEALQTKDFERIRIGIENRNGLDITGLDYVLYKFSEEEIDLVHKTIVSIIKTIEETKKEG